MQDKYETLRNAERMVLGRKLAQAIREYEKLLQSVGDDPGILNTLGDLLLKDGRRDEALRRFRRVADIFVQGGYSAKAVAVCKKILQVNPADAETSGLLVELYERQGMVPEAVRHLEGLSARFRTWGKLEEALRAQQRILKLDQDSPSHLLEAGRLYSHLGESVQAAQMFSEAVERLLGKGMLEDAEKALLEAQRMELEGPLIDKAVEALQHAAMPEAGAVESGGEDAEAGHPKTEDTPASEGSRAEAVQTGGFELSPEPVRLDSDAEGAVEAGRVQVNGSDRIELQRFDDFLRSAPQDESASPDASQEGVSGLWSPEEADEDGMDFASDEVSTAPNALSDQQPEAGQYQGTLEDGLQEADFYLKLGYGEEARSLLTALVREFPQDERVLRRAEKAMVPLPESETREELLHPGGEDAEIVSFDQQIDRALDQLFTDDGEEPADEILRYDVTSDDEEASEEDPKAHYELGLAYKEMGLLEDSIEKFTEAFRLFEDDRNVPHKILCCSMLASSHIRLGDYEKARDWADWGLELPDLKDFERKALRYDASYAREQLGELEAALEGYRQIVEKDSGYRDVEERIDMLSVQVDAQ